MVYKLKLAVLTIVVLFLLGAPLAYQANATDVFASIKFGLDTAAKAAAHGAFKAISTRILNKIQNSGIGGALFVQDWREFQLSSQYRGEEIFRGVLKSTQLCNYFGNDLKKVFGAERAVDVSRVLSRTNSFDSFQAKAGCTLPSDFSYDDYKRDFSGNGGWEAWSRLMEPQNNYYGSLFLSLEEAGKQRALEEAAATNEAISGKGYTGLRDCLVQAEGRSGCAVLGRIKTPGSTIGEQVSSVFDTNLKFYTTADAASLAVALVTEWLVGNLLEQGLAPDPGTTISDFNPGTDPKEITNSYLSEFCSASDNMSTIPTAQYIYNESQPGGLYPNTYQMFPPEEDINSGEATDDNDVGKSYCKWRYDVDDNKAPFTRCMRACYQKVGITEGDNLLTPQHIGPDGRWIDAGGLGNVPPPEPEPGNSSSTPENPNYPDVCATDEEIEQFLIGNPGDEGRLSSAFPCP